MSTIRGQGQLGAASATRRRKPGQNPTPATPTQQPIQVLAQDIQNSANAAAPATKATPEQSGVTKLAGDWDRSPAPQTGQLWDLPLEPADPAPQDPYQPDLPPAPTDPDVLVDQVGQTVGMGSPDRFERNPNETGGDPSALPPAGGQWLRPTEHPTKSEQQYNETSHYIYQEMNHNVRSEFTQRIRDEWSGGLGTKKRALDEFALAVQTGGPWDHKPTIQRMLGATEGSDFYLQQPGTDRQVFYDIYSNIHYGFVGASTGVPTSVIELAPTLGTDATGATDDGDRITVKAGIDMYQKYGADMTEEQFQQALGETVGKLSDADAAGKSVNVIHGYK